MASITIQSTGKFSAEDLSASSIETQDRILIAQAEIVVSEQVKNAQGMLDEKGFSVGITSRSIKAQSPKNVKGSRGLYITFEGSRPNGRSSKRTALVAFLNEYGIAGRMSSRGFIAKANEATADQCAETAADIYAAWVADQIQF